jgi:hypothetical protein
MANALTTGQRYMTGHGTLMLCVGLATCTLASLMASSAFAEFGYAIAVVLSASCLLIVGAYLGVLVLTERSHCPIAHYLMAGLLSVVCWLVFWLLGSAPTELRLLTLLAGLHGVVWSLWYVRLAFYLKAFPRKAALLSILAATTSFLGIALATESELTQLSAATLAAYYTMIIGIGILLTRVYFHRELKIEGRLLHLQQREVSIHADPRRPKTPSVVTEPEAEEKFA